MRFRALEIEDLSYLYQWENDAATWTDSDTHNPLSQHLLREYIANSTGDIYKDGQLRLIVEDEGRTLGCVDLFDFDARSRKAAIGMYISPLVRGKGVGKQVLAMLEEYAFGFLGLHTLYAIIRETNAACRGLYESAGYRNAGVLQDWVRSDNEYVNAIIYQKVYEKAAI
ncbi:MAG: GNAT family N-acetyltransferase [Paludibacteraceae bacterium]|nr:GNAT family N-acetyltransferase [Paludibacteraceae bacterium]